ncbi:hypothetical protein [Haladaptatus sp. GCM10025893]
MTCLPGCRRRSLGGGLERHRHETRLPGTDGGAAVAFHRERLRAAMAN